MIVAPKKTLLMKKKIGWPMKSVHDLKPIFSSS